MDSQEKKRMLKKYQTSEAEERRLRREILRWRSKTEKMTSVIKAVPGGGGDGRSLENSVEAIQAVEEELEAQIKNSIRLRRRICAAIDQMDDDRCKQLLKLKYIDGYSWSEVAEIMDISERGATKMHGRALAKIDLSSLQFPYLL